MATTYNFALCSVSGDIEDLGDIELENDAEAVSFGAAVIEDILREHFAAYSGSVMIITDQERIVRAAELKIEPEMRQKKIN